MSPDLKAFARVEQKRCGVSPPSVYSSVLLKDMVVDSVKVAGAAAFQKNRPDEDWLAARTAHEIPEPLYQLYVQTNFLSHSPRPPLFDDPLLFGYFETLIGSLKDLFLDEELRAFLRDQNLTYDPGKLGRNEKWEMDAARRARRHFKYLLIALHGTLDTFADLVALFFTKSIPHLRVGKAQFLAVEKWLSGPSPSTSTIATVREHFFEQLHTNLRPLVLAAAPEQDWLPLMRLYRDKAAHVGYNSIFQCIGLADKGNHFYTFLPRKWPFVWDSHITMGEPPQLPKPAKFVVDFVSEDIIAYAEGLVGKVQTVVSEGLSIIDAVYKQLKNSPLNQLALSELNNNKKSYAFEHFTAT
jgi:hypothetical protein